MPSLGASIGYNFFAQLFGRFISFAINLYLFRVVDSDVIGVVNVRLTLLYNTILFLTREPLRKGRIFEGTLLQFVNIIWLSPLIAVLLSIICCVLWNFFSSTSKEIPTLVFVAFPLAAVIESIGEPFAIFSLRFSLVTHYAWSQCLLISLQRVLVIVLLFTSNLEPLIIYSLAQVIASTFYTSYHFFRFKSFSRQGLLELNRLNNFREFFPQFQHGINKESLSSMGYLFGHSILKQLATDCSGYLMTFSEITSLKEQAVFDAIEKLGSLVCRIILAPLEENCAAHFRNEIHRSSKKVVDSFVNILHVSSVIGLIICLFGMPYSKLAVWVYGGKLLIDNQGEVLLSIFCIYILIMAINGITECFAMSTMNNSQLLKHSYFLLFLAVLQPIVAYNIVTMIGVAGFLVSKCLDMLMRIVYSWHQAKQYLGEKLLFSKVFPSFSIIASMVLASLVTAISYQYNGDIEIKQIFYHLGFGGLSFAFLVLFVIFYDPVFHKLAFPSKVHSD